MATEQSTLDKITGWASDKYTAAAPALNGSMSGARAATAAPTGTSGDTGLLAAASTSSAPKSDVSSWYRATLGRDGDQAGIDFWQKQLDGGANEQDLYKAFQSAASTNKESVKTGTSWADANNYKGATSSYGNTSADEWGRNVLGRDLSDDERTKWSSALAGAATPDAARKVYQDFLAANAGQVKHSLDMNQASQLGGLQTGTANTINKGDLAVRNVNGKTETVNGQLQSIMAADSPLLQQARADGARTAFDRGLGNSSIAASAGEDSLLRAALQIATPDAATYGKAADYNVAAENQATMYNAEAQNQFGLADKNNDAAAINADKNLAAQQAQQQAQLSQQMTIAQMQDQTNRWQAEMQDKTSRYNTDNSYKQQVDNQKLGVANNIIANMEMSPDRKAALLEQLGFGTSAAPGKAGTGLAGAVYVIDSTSADLNSGAGKASAAANALNNAF